MSHAVDERLLSLAISERAPDADWASFSPADWERIVHLAQTEGVGPLLYWALSRSGEISSAPKQVGDSLRAMYYSTRMNNEQIIKELESLTGRFDQAGIPVVALKGVCFALTVYPDIGLRPMVDLDLLVPASKSSQALEIARASGYVNAVTEASAGLDGLLNHAVCLKKTDAPFTTLELHHSLVAERAFTYAIPVNWFWSQTEPMPAIPSKNSIGNLRMLKPTAQVLYASAHAMLQHGGRNTSLRWLYDLDRLIRVYAERERLDWGLLVYQARVFEWSSAVSAALSQVVDYFDTPVPPNVLDDLSRRADRNTERVATLQKPPATHTLEEYQKLKSLNWYGRLRLALALLVPTPAYMCERYKLETSWALPAWYLYRWWEILKDGVKTAVILIQKAVMQASN